MLTESQRSPNHNGPTAPRVLAVRAAAHARGPSQALLVLGGVLAGGLLAGGSMWYWSAGESAKTGDATVTEVGMAVLLPSDLKPRVAEMVNPEPFKDDPFWSQAAIGDKILIYPYRGEIVRAIIWRPSEKKVVDIGLVSIAPGSDIAAP